MNYGYLYLGIGIIIVIIGILLISQSQSIFVSQKMLNGTLSGTVSVDDYCNNTISREVDVYSTDGTIVVGKTFSDTNGKYSLQLPIGNYIIYNYPFGIERSPHPVWIHSGQNTIFNIENIYDCPKRMMPYAVNVPPK